MSIADNARTLMVQADVSELKALVQSINNGMMDKVTAANELLGEEHVGVEAIAGPGVNVQELCERLTEALGLFEFTMQNVCQQIISGG